MDYAYQAYSEYIKKSSLSADMGLPGLRQELSRFWDRVMISVSQSTSDTHIRNAYRMLVQQARTQCDAYDWLDAPEAYYSFAASTEKTRRIPWLLLGSVVLLAGVCVWLLLPFGGKQKLLAAIVAIALALSAGQYVLSMLRETASPLLNIRTEQRISPERVRSGLLRMVREVDGHAQSLRAILDESAPGTGEVDLSLAQELLRLPEEKRTAEILDAVDRYLIRSGVEKILYSADRQELFVQLPGAQTRTIEPALVKDGRLLHMGVACVAMED